MAFKTWLLQLGLSADTAVDKQVPRRVMTASKPVVRGFLQGLFDTDGTVDRRCSYVEYYSSSERLIRQVQVILLNFGIVSRLHEKPVPYQGERRPAWRLTISGEDAQTFYREIGFRLSRKQSGREGLPAHSNTNVDVVPRQVERLIELRETVRLPKRVGKRYERMVAGLRAPSYRMLGQFLSDVVAIGRPAAGMPPAVETVAYEQLTDLQEAHHLWDPVAEIVPGEAEVYDFTIPMFHSFVSNGFISHNSYLAQAISSEAGVPFCYASAPSFQSMWFGVSNLRVMWIYRRARKLAQKHGACIIFIDEIDAIGMSRSGQTASGAAGFFGAGLGLLNELLLQMDPPPIDRSWWRRFLRAIGLRPKPGQRPTVLTIGATNLPQVLDPALLRPGRFDRQITVDLPDLDGRKEIIEYYLSKVKHRDMPVDRLAAETIGYSPVRIKHVINEAVVMAHFAGRDAVTYEDFVAARDVHEFGLRQPIRNMSKEERRRIAYHEAGHAVAQVKLLKHERIVRATIVRHGQALGFVSGKPLEERYLSDKDELLAEIQVYLASRAAEKLCLGTELTGVTDDLRQATRIAAAYLGFFGMGDSLYSSLAFGEQRPTGAQRTEIEKILKEQYKKVEKLLKRHRAAVEAVAQALIEREELMGDEVIALVEAAPVDESVDDGREERGIGFRLPPVRRDSDEPAATPAARGGQ